MADQLKLQKDLEAEVVVDFGGFKADIAKCKIYANGKNDADIVFIAQDENDPNRKIQVTIKKK